MSQNKEERTWGMDLEPFPQPCLQKEVKVKNYNKYNRKLTNEDVAKYDAMVEKYIRDFCVKNWSNDLASHNSKTAGDVPLGNTGTCVNDIRQDLKAEVCVALYNYNPEYRTKEGRSVKESTFVFNHLFNRIGQKMKRLTKKRYGYGIRHSQLENEFWELDDN